MSSKKKKTSAGRKNAGGPAAVKLKRRDLLDGSINALTPENITNSGKSDDGWMDSIGVRAAGLGYLFDESPYPMDKFISNNAYARAGFAQMQFELYPPLELMSHNGEPTTRENLIQFLKVLVNGRENNIYKAGQYTVHDSPRIDNPREVSDGNADLIVTYWYERKCDAKVNMPNCSDLPDDLTAKEQYGALYFSGKGIVVMNGTNFERHNRPINVMEILLSVRYIRDTPYLGFTRGLSPATLTFDWVPRSPSSTKVPKLCFSCGVDTKSTVKRCSQCKVAFYCSVECQKADWKRHKNGECLPRLTQDKSEKATNKESV